MELIYVKGKIMFVGAANNELLVFPVVNSEGRVIKIIRKYKEYNNRR